MARQAERASLESGITEKILKYLNALPGCHAEKIHTGKYGKRGTPDIFGVYLGRALVFEVKRPGRGATPLQLHVLGLWGGAGAVVGIVSSIEDVEECLRHQM